jgi:hypothetical protein
MTTAAIAAGRSTAEAVGRWPRARRVAALALGALAMTWPAILNGYPLLYPDSMTYLEDGRRVARALFLHQTSAYYGMRSLLYSLVILPLHRNVNPWPVVVLQALLTAWVLWLTVRSIARGHPTAKYLATVVVLSVITSLSWFVSLIMPDILGPVLYLAIYLLVFGRETLSRWEKWVLLVVAWWAAASHATHLMLGVALCVLLSAVLSLRRDWRRMRGVAEAALALVLAAAVPMALDMVLYGTPSVQLESPPYLTARAIADGPGRWYAERDCGQRFAVCAYVGRFPDDPDIFLWDPAGIYHNAPKSVQKQMEKQDAAFALAAVRRYPWAQLRRSMANFRDQLLTFGVDDFDPNEWTLSQFDMTLPGAKARYEESREARNLLPMEAFTTLQNWAVLVALVAVGILLPLVWRVHDVRVRPMALVAITAFVVVGNALLTGTMSTLDERLQSRVVWLVPLAAAMLLLAWMERRWVATD